MFLVWKTSHENSKKNKLFKIKSLKQWRVRKPPQNPKRPPPHPQLNYRIIFLDGIIFRAFFLIWNDCIYNKVLRTNQQSNKQTNITIDRSIAEDMNLWNQYQSWRLTQTTETETTRSEILFPSTEYIDLVSNEIENRRVYPLCDFFEFDEFINTEKPQIYHSLSDGEKNNGQNTKQHQKKF